MIDESSLAGGRDRNYQLPHFIFPLHIHGTAIAFPEMMMISFFTTTIERATPPTPMFVSPPFGFA